jgi:hypothetical protein
MDLNRTGARRVALIVGNSSYAQAPLPNTRRDAEAIAATLDRMSFTSVRQFNDLTQSRFSSALADFGEEAEGAEIAVMFYAGHGIEVGGETYLLPVDAELSHVRRLKFETQQLTDVLTAVGGAKKLGLVILDACRNNPMRSNVKGIELTRSAAQGLSAIEPTGSVLVAYAAKHGTVARDGSGQENSPFTRALLDFIETPNLDVRLLFGKVRDAVLARTGGAQEPHLYGALGGREVYLNHALDSNEAANVFLSYAKKDKQRVEPLVRQLQARGWTVFWDQDLIVGDDWREVIEWHLDNAQCIVTAWSKESNQSDWVKYEATRGRDQGILVPVSIDGTPPPKLFDSVQTEDLGDWDGKSGDPRLTRVLLGVQTVLGRRSGQAEHSADNVRTGPNGRRGARRGAGSAEQHWQNAAEATGRSIDAPNYGRLIGIGAGVAIASAVVVMLGFFLVARQTPEPRVVEKIIEKQIPVLLQPPQPAMRPRAAETRPETPAPTAPRAAEAPRAAPPPPSEMRREPPRETASLPDLFMPVIGSMKIQQNAMELADEVRSKARDALRGSSVAVRIDNVGDLGTFYRVVVEPPRGREQAERICSDLKSTGYKGCFLIAQPRR